MLSLLAWSLLVRSTLVLSLVVPVLVNIDPLHAWIVHMMGTSLSGHVKDGRRLARIIDNDVVDIVVVDDVCDVASPR